MKAKFIKSVQIISFLFLLISKSISQTPQIALVKPDGTTTIHSSFSSAYESANDDDRIYVPGGYFSLVEINKKIHLVGAGSDIDSSFVTGRTIIPGCTFGTNGSGSTIEGFNINGDLLIKCSNIVGSRLVIGFDVNLNFPGIDNVILKNNIMNLSFLSSCSNLVLSNNIINGGWMNFYDGQGIDFNNNIIFSNFGYGAPNNSLFNNNIFSGHWINTSGSVFNHNVNVSANGSNEFNNNITEDWIDIFIDPPSDYHIKETSQCHNSGTDGTDRGIYGGDFPWPEGLVPSNPHIMLKQIPGTTNPNGNLQINVKVRTGD